tara:strand:- start:387 stop:791 length:405 start_codon:yes stop_codon:yes gene_type:complete
MNTALILTTLAKLGKKLSRESTTKEEEFDIKKMIKELKLKLKPSDRQPGIEKANNRKTPKVPNYKDATPASLYPPEKKNKSDATHYRPVGTPTQTQIDQIKRLAKKQGKTFKHGGSVNKKAGRLAKRGYGAAKK